VLNLIEIYEACHKPEKAQKRRAKLPQTEAAEEWQITFFRNRKMP
jgi:hypothetical protein